jgi:hypothetical protein
MSQQLLQVPRQTDNAVIECFKSIAEELSIAQFSISVIGYPTLGQIDFNEENHELEAIVNSDSTLIDTLSINVSGLQMTYHRGGTVMFNRQEKVKSPYFDEVLFTTTNNITLSGEDRSRVAAMVAEKLSAYSPERGLGETPEQVQLTSIHNATLERLERLNENLVSSTHEYRNKIDSEFSEKRESLESEYLEKLESLNDELLRKNEALKSESDELEKRRQELDDKDNTHARREIRKDILQEIKNRQKEFKLTDGTVSLRKPIFVSMLILVTIFITGSLFTGLELFVKDLTGNEFIISVVKQVFYSAGAVGSLIFFIRWMNRWLEQHSQTEFHLKQFELDMERASWLVETSLEWNDAKGTIMPPELMESLSANLFNDKSEIEHVIHPADQLASALFGSASSIKLKTGDSLVEIDPKKLNKQASA